MDIKQLVEEIATHLTGAQSSATLVEDEFGAVITIVINGKVSSFIGKDGNTIDALRTLLKAIGHNDKHRIKLKLDEQDA